MFYYSTEVDIKLILCVWLKEVVSIVLLWSDCGYLSAFEMLTNWARHLVLRSGRSKRSILCSKEVVSTSLLCSVPMRSAV